ncbi:uncharacterized protein LOC136063100 [Quercus suber]|uniref:uncharacterized protein LOC136063100 n=1 Tax=Quercus suber TaxID=58331 RepID=UPI0032DE91F2
MAIYSKDEALMCKVFPSSLGPIAMRWFDDLKAESISSFHELTQAFGSRFVTCRRVPRSLASLLSLSMQEGENLKTYSDRYWELFNERVEEDQQQGKGKDKVILQERRDFRSDRYSNNKPCRDFARQSGLANLQTVNAVFREPVHQVLKKIKYEPFFKRPNKMMGNLKRCNHNLYCQYHQDHGHTTEDCRSLWDHLDQLVCEGKLKQLLHHSSGQGRQAGDINQDPKRAKMEIPPVLSFSDEDKIGTIQPHDDALVVTLRIGGYDVRKVMVDQGSGAEIISAEEAKCEDLAKVAIGADPEKFFQVGSQLPPQEKEELIEFLRRNIDVFAWNAYKALGVDLEFICHNLNVNPLVTPKKQSPRRPSKEHVDAVREEVAKLK